jgi:hypothetical protein
MSDKKTLSQLTIEKTVSTVIVLLVAGFFGILWSESMRLDECVEDLQDKQETCTSKQSAASEVFSEEIAKLRTGLRRLENLIDDFHSALGEDEIEIMERIREPSNSDEREPSALKIRQEVQSQIHERAKK